MIVPTPIPADQRASSRDRLLPSAPIDKYQLVCIGFSILGITTLLPWNFFITATEYWMYKFRDTDDGTYDYHEPHTSQRNQLQTFFTSYLAVAANIPFLLSMILSMLYGHRFSQKRRLYISLIIMLVVFATTTLFVGINTDSYQNVFFAITMFMVFLINIFSALFQASMFGIAASFPKRFMHALVNGQAVAGLLAVTIQILSMLNNSGPIKSGLWYFLTSTIFLALAIFCYWLMDNDYSRYYLVHLPEDLQISGNLPETLIRSKADILDVLKSSWQLVLVVIIAFWSTLAVYPGVCVLVAPTHPNTSFLTGRFFTPIVTFLLYNCGDLAGRLTSAFLPFPVAKKNTLLGITIVRVIIPFMIIFCNVIPRHHTSVWFTSDLYYPIFNVATALTQGYTFSSAMVMASTNSARERVELTGFIMTTALGVGLTLGSISSTILLLLI